MTSAKTKRMRDQLMREHAEQKRHKLWNPDLPAAELAHFREVSAAYFEHMDTLALPCAVPRVVDGRGQSEATPMLSHVGGDALWPSSEAWPTDDDGAAQPVMLGSFRSDLRRVRRPARPVAAARLLTHACHIERRPRSIGGAA